MPKITIPQQSLNLLRQYLAQPGWAKSNKLIYLGGQLEARTLPDVDTTWVLSEQQIEAMTIEGRKGYREQDKAWCASPVEIELSESERETIKICLQKLTEAGTFGPNKWNFPLFEAFGFKPE